MQGGGIGGGLVLEYQRLFSYLGITFSSPLRSGLRPLRTVGKTPTYLPVFNSTCLVREEIDMGHQISILGGGEGRGKDSPERNPRWFSFWEDWLNGPIVVKGPQFHHLQP